MSKKSDMPLFTTETTTFAGLLPRNAVDESNYNAVDLAITQIVDYFKTERPEVFAGIQSTYDFKKEHNPTMPKFDDWYRDVFARRVFEEANRFCGGYTLETAKRIVEIEYLYTPFLRKVRDTYIKIGVGAYVEEGRINIRVDVPSDLDKQSNCTARIVSDMKQCGYDDAEAVYDYDDEITPVVGSRKFVPPLDK